MSLTHGSFIVGVTKYHNIGYLSCGEKHTQNSIYIRNHFERFLFFVFHTYTLCSAIIGVNIIHCFQSFAIPILFMTENLSRPTPKTSKEIIREARVLLK